MEGEKFGKLREAKECQFGNIEDHTLRNLKHFFFFLLAAIYLFAHENITSFLSCRFQKACQCQILIECLETITV